MPVEGDELRADHLSPAARSQHRNLLIAASVGLIFVILEPKRIAALGVSIDSSERGWLVALLVAAIVYFEIAFLTASRADFHIWRRQLTRQRAHLVALTDETAYKQAQTQLTANLTDGEDQVEIHRRWDELNASRANARADHEHLVPIVRWFEIRGWFDFWLAPVYGAAVVVLLVGDRFV